MVDPLEGDGVNRGALADRPILMKLFLELFSSSLHRLPGQAACSPSLADH